MQFRLTWTLLIVLSVVLVADEAMALPVTYDFETDYATGAMGDVWRYRSTTGAGAMQDMVWAAPYSFPGWQPAGDATSGIFVMSDTLYLHPGLGSDPMVQFVTPNAGWYDIAVQVTDANGSGGNGIAATLSHNLSAATSPFSGLLASAGVNAQGGSVLAFNAAAFFLEADSVLNLVINPLGDPNYDATLLEMTITETVNPDGEAVTNPEPGTLLLLGIGLLGVTRTVRKRRQQNAA